ncbi:tetraspanin-2 [Jatropha curcas]|nr:tetraspanin-2 [Jatropha curcas]
MVSGLGFKEFRLEDFLRFLQKYSIDQHNWVHIKECSIDSRTCKNLIIQTSVQKESDFYRMKLSPLESGCCIPPPSCHLEYKNPTIWTMPESGLAMNNDRDCTTWNNNQHLLCYECKSCKAGILANLRDEYRLLFIYYDILTILFLILVYFIGC